MRIDRDSWNEIITVLMRNKTRSLLTAFGIFWGIFMWVLLMGGGRGLEQMLGNNFKGFATNSAFFVTDRTAEPYAGFREGRTWSLNLPDLEQVRRQVDGAEVVTPIIMSWSNTGIRGMDGRTSDGMLRGIHADLYRLESVSLRYGRPISAMDVAQNRRVCVIGAHIYDELFPRGGNPCRTFINANGVYYQIIGVVNDDSNISIGGNPATTVSVPYTTLQRVTNRGNEFDMLALMARPGHSVADLGRQVEYILKQRHQIAPTDKQAVVFINLEAMFNMVDSLFRGIRLLVWLIGIGTLLSGVVGVSNIMMVTVRERTVELGIRRAIGAYRQDIVAQIVCEAVVLTIVAGSMGIMLAVAVLAGVEKAAASGGPASFQIPFSWALGAVGALLLLGVAAGVAPAIRALSIKPVDAMREE